MLSCAARWKTSLMHTELAKTNGGVRLPALLQCQLLVKGETKGTANFVCNPFKKPGNVMDDYFKVMISSQ